MLFDRSKLKLKSLKKRIHGLDAGIVLPLEKKTRYQKSFQQVARKIVLAKNRKRQIILMIGGHVIRSGVQRYLIDLMKRGFITCLAMNGSCIIHDYEISLIGATTESVSSYIKDGQFGLWKETGKINDIINKAYKNGKTGIGKAVGKAIYEGNFPYKDISLLAACYKLNIPATVHVGIGYDIIHEHPNCSGAATGETSYRDFLLFTKVMEKLEDGVVMNFGSAVMSPEVFLKALSMVKNVAVKNGKDIRHFTTLVCDLLRLPSDFNKEPPKNDAMYYFRPWKTMLVRAVANGGKSFYIRGNHLDTVPALWSAITEEEMRIGRKN